METVSISPVRTLLTFIDSKYMHLLPVYFVLWDEAILQSMLNPNTPLGKKAYRDLANLTKPHTNSSVDKSSSVDGPYRSDWLEVAQQDMADIAKIRLSNELVGKLYRLAEEHSKTDGGDWDIYNEDSIAFAKAYKDAMVRRLKHLSRVSLCAL